MRYLAVASGALALGLLLTGCGAPTTKTIRASPPPRGAGASTKAAGSPTAGGAPTEAESPAPSSSPSESPATSLSACSVLGQLGQWSIDRLTAQLVVVPAQESDVMAVAAEVDQGAGGVLLFGSYAPADLGAQLRAMETSAPGGVAPLVMTDEEGGGVQRMANLVGSLPWARQMGSTMTPATIQSLAESVGRRMRAAGVTMDLAPVLDMDGGVGPNARDPDGERSFSVQPALAAADGLAFAAGLLAAGVIPVVKHFPGLGGATANTDYGPADTLPYATLEKGGLIPFEDAAAAGMPVVMVSNATVPGLTSGPASLSAAAIQGLLRGQMQFQGLVITDSLGAGAITALGLSVPQATVDALVAGADMVMFSSGAPGTVLAAIEAAVTAAVAAGRLSRATLVDAVTHVLATKGANLCSSG